MCLFGKDVAIDQLAVWFVKNLLRSTICGDIHARSHRTKIRTRCFGPGWLIGIFVSKRHHIARRSYDVISLSPYSTNSNRCRTVDYLGVTCHDHTNTAAACPSSSSSRNGLFEDERVDFQSEDFGRMSPYANPNLFRRC